MEWRTQTREWNAKNVKAKFQSVLIDKFNKDKKNKSWRKFEKRALDDRRHKIKKANDPENPEAEGSQENLNADLATINIDGTPAPGEQTEKSKMIADLNLTVPVEGGLLDEMQMLENIINENVAIFDPS